METTPTDEGNYNIPLGTLVLFCCVSSFLIGYVGWSVLLVILPTALFYRLVSRRIARKNMFSEHQIKQKMDQEQALRTGNVEWLNMMVAKLWAVLEPTLSVRITEKLNALLQGQMPGMLESLELTEFTLGSSPPNILHAEVVPGDDANVIDLDLKICFLPADLDEGEHREEFVEMIEKDMGRTKSMQWNSKVLLVAKIGKAFMTMDVPVLLKELCIFGKLRVRFLLGPSQPIVKTIQLSFAELPKFDFILRPLKSLDLMDMPGLSSWLEETLGGVIASKMVAPNVVTIPIAANMPSGSGGGAIGVLKVTVLAMRGVRLEASDGTYVRLQLAGKVKACTLKANNETRRWDQTFYLLVGSLRQPLNLVMMTGSGQIIGSTSFSLQDIESESAASTEEMWRTIVGHESSRVKGELCFGVQYYPAVDFPDPEADIKASSGILQVTLHQLKDIFPEKEDKKHANCYYELYLHARDQKVKQGEESNYRSKTKKRMLQPSWDESCNLFIARKEECELTVLVQRENGSIASWTSPVEQLLNRTDWFLMDQPADAQLYGSFLFRPVQIELNGMASKKATPCIGLLQLRVKEACGLKKGKGYHVEATLRDNVIGKTEASIGDEDRLLWNKSFTAIVNSPDDQVHMEVFLTDKTQLVGSTLVSIQEIIRQPCEQVEQSLDLIKPTGEIHGKIKLSLGFYPVRRDDDIEHGREEEFPVMEAEPLHVDSNCGIVEVHRMELRGLRDRPLNALYSVSLAWNDYHPSFTSSCARASLAEGSVQWNRLVELLARETTAEELNLSFTIEEHADGAVHHLGVVKIPLMDALSNHWYPVEGICDLLFECRYEPLPLLLEPEIIESGTLYGQIIGAQNLIAVDSNGTSDPFCVVRLNGTKVHKTKVVKKCLNPQFDKEEFEVPIRQRNASILEVELRDWNKMSFSRTLGTVRMDLLHLKTDGDWCEYNDLPLTKVSSGTVHLKLKFVVSENQEQMEQQLLKSEKEDSLHDLSESHLGMTKSMRSSRLSVLGLDSAAGIKFTILNLDFSEEQTKLECKIKIRHKGETLFKTKEIRNDPTPRWNETFTIKFETMHRYSPLEIKLVWNREGTAHGWLQYDQLSFGQTEDETDTTIVVSLTSEKNEAVGKLRIRYMLTIDRDEILEEKRKHRRRLSSFFNKS